MWGRPISVGDRLETTSLGSVCPLMYQRTSKRAVTQDLLQLSSLYFIIFFNIEGLLYRSTLIIKCRHLACLTLLTKYVNLIPDNCWKYRGSMHVLNQRWLLWRHARKYIQLPLAMLKSETACRERVLYREKMIITRINIKVVSRYKIFDINNSSNC